MDINVKKRNGETEKFNADKIHKVLAWAVEGYKGVSAEEIEINARLNMRDGISTDEIHQVVIETAANLISVDKSNYQYVAGRLLNYQLRKKVWGGKNPPRPLDLLKKNIDKGVYDPALLEKYTEEEVNKLGEMIDHDRDFIFTYAGIQQMCDKYLIRNRYNKQFHETPQFAYLFLAMAGFANYDKSKRITYVKRAYNYFSKHKLSIPTPIMAGLRSTLRSYSSCCLVGIDDNKESLTASATAISLATAARYGIGLYGGAIRPLGSPVKNGEIIHTGVFPFLKIYEASVKAWQQNAIRGGSATVDFPWWHHEIETVIALKNGSGTDDNRARKLDYAVGFTRLFYERVQKDQDITLFSPFEAKELNAAYGTTNFDKEYIAAENNPKLKFKKVIRARKLMEQFVKERTETGRIYVLNVDHANDHGTFNERVLMSNLCREVIHPVIPIKDINDPEGEIGICSLIAVNTMGVKPDEYEKVCDLGVRFLNEVIDLQEYFIPAAAKFAKNYRSLAIGLTGFAGTLAYNSLKYSSPEAIDFADELAERLSYYCIKASIELAKERGPFPYFQKTKWAQGILPLDTYKKSIDKVVKRKPTQDWDGLRAELKQWGIYNSTLLSFMPCESSSVIQNSPNGIEPISSVLTYKDSKEKRLPVLLPGAGKWHDNYEKAFDIRDNRDIININAAIQKWTCMALSTNLYYNYSHYPDGKLPDAVVTKDILYAYSMGLKSLYYSKTDDGDKEQSLVVEEEGCAGGACSI